MYAEVSEEEYELCNAIMRAFIHTLHTVGNHKLDLHILCVTIANVCTLNREMTPADHKKFVEYLAETVANTVTSELDSYMRSMN